MHSWHAKSQCCKAKIYHFGLRRRQCSQCKRTWRIRRKRRGRKCRRSRPGTLHAVFVEGRTLKTLGPRYELTRQGLSRRFRRVLQQFTSRPRSLRLARGPLVLILDGLYFRFRRKDWVLYVMALKPCHQNRAVFLDPVLRPGRENMQGWAHAFNTIPPRHPQTGPGLGLRRSFRDRKTGHQPGLDRSTLPFSSHQPIAELPRSTKSQTAWKTVARSSLPTYSSSPRAPR